MPVCEACGVAHAKLQCARCGQAWYCGRACQKRDWRSGHKHSCADRAALTDVDGNAAQKRPSPFGAAPREMYIPQDEATAFIESREEGFWEGVNEKGCALFPGLRWIYTANVTAPGGSQYWIVEGTSENLLLAVCTREDGTMVCQSREDLAERGWDRARIEVAYEEHRAFAENVRRMVEGDVWSIRDTPLLVRCEHDSGGYACRVLLVDSDNVGDATSLPWWRSALSHERVLELYRSREAARGAAGQVFVFARVVPPRLGRDDLRRACEDCHRATESKHTGWLRAGLEEDADILGDGLGRLHGRILEALRDLGEAPPVRPRATDVDGEAVPIRDEAAVSRFLESGLAGDETLRVASVDKQSGVAFLVDLCGADWAGVNPACAANAVLGAKFYANHTFQRGADPRAVAPVVADALDAAAVAALVARGVPGLKSCALVAISLDFEDYAACDTAMDAIRLTVARARVAASRLARSKQDRAAAKKGRSGGGKKGRGKKKPPPPLAPSVKSARNAACPVCLRPKEAQPGAPDAMVDPRRPGPRGGARAPAAENELLRQSASSPLTGSGFESGGAECRSESDLSDPSTRVGGARGAQRQQRAAPGPAERARGDRAPAPGVGDLRLRLAGPEPAHARDARAARGDAGRRSSRVAVAAAAAARGLRAVDAVLAAPDADGLAGDADAAGPRGARDASEAPATRCGAAPGAGAAERAARARAALIREGGYLWKVPGHNVTTAARRRWFRLAPHRPRNGPQEETVAVTWCDPRALRASLSSPQHGFPPEPKVRSLALADVVELRPGHATPAWWSQASARKALPVEDLCWSLVSRDNKTLDLAAETVQEARLWKEALAAILRELGGPQQTSAQPTTANPVALRLKRAVAEGRRDEVASLLASRQIETDAALDESGDTALLLAPAHVAIASSHDRALDVLALLLDGGGEAAIDARDSAGARRRASPRCAAALRELLLQTAADASCADARGLTPRDVAVKANQYDIADLVMGYEATGRAGAFGDHRRLPSCGTSGR
ncbi:hypothetical protein JL720_136 [Aureococcus anophagefferens]|nr:hypothetical protein JL720_136 [Aureococcus anophagefferens]